MPTSILTFEQALKSRMGEKKEKKEEEREAC